MTRARFYTWLPVVILAAVVVLIYFTNLSGQFWLSGWDNLHPEFNYNVNVERALFSSWQEYQGLGLPAGNGHATELFREVFMWGLSGIVPAEAVRKVYLALMLFVGATGIYVLMRNVILREGKEKLKIGLGLAGSLFYLLHPATVQIFFLPYEAFMAQFGFLPWMVFGLINYLQKRSTRALGLLVLVNLLGSTQFYIPTLFLVYAPTVLILTIGWLWEQGSGSRLKVGLVALLAILITNLYWLLPFGYYSAVNISSQTEAYLNWRYSEDTYLKNAKFGDLADTVLSRGFLLDFTDVLDHNTYGYMMEPWRSYWRSLPISAGELVLFVVVLTGLIVSLKKRQSLYFGLLLLMFFSLLAVKFFPFNLVNEFLRKSSLFDQVLRNPYTKLANGLLLVEAVFFVLGLKWLLEMFSWRWPRFGEKWPPMLVVGGVVVLINLVIWPIWSGNLVYSRLKVTIPADYAAVFKFFAGKGDGRIANFPQFANDGWDVYRWGYRGSGFLWYGIKQPILDRAFDVWNGSNENYYWELSYAIFSKNTALLTKVMDKYGVSWLLVDGNVVNPSSPKALFLLELQAMLASSARFRLAGQFGQIQIYEFRLARPESGFVSVAQDLPKVVPKYQWNNDDAAFWQVGDYIDETGGYFYPFRSLFTGRRQSEIAFLPGSISLATTAGVIWIDPMSDKTVQVAQNCDSFSRGQVTNEVQSGERKFLRISSVGGATNCVVFNLPSLVHGQGYLIKTQTRNVSGRPLLFWLENFDSRRSDQAVYLPAGAGNAWVTSYFIQPPMESDGLGYGVHFDGITISDEESVNDLTGVEISPIDYWGLVGQRTGLATGTTKYLAAETFQVAHPNPSFYRVDLSAKNLSEDTTLILSQSFESGWTAVAVNSKEQLGKLDTHVLVDNWANGWKLSGDERIVYIFFWPQLLEFAGLGVLGVCLMVVLMAQLKLRVWRK